MSVNPSIRRSPSRRWIPESRLWSAAALPLASLAALGLLAVSFSVHTHAVSGGVVHASKRICTDPDGDGLSDAQEKVLGTSSIHADTDGDGFSDLEEVARHSDPTLPISTPLPTDFDLGMTARGEAGENRVLIAVYLADGDPQNKEIHVGVAVAGRLLALPPEYYAVGMTTRLIPARAAGEALLVLDLPFDMSLVHTYGSLSVFASLHLPGEPLAKAADAVDLAGVDGIPCLAAGGSREPRPRPMLMGFTGTGSIYTPIPPDGEDSIPDTWAAGEICYQTSMPVGAHNGIITHEIVDASCISDWDGYCRSDCTSSTGTTFETFDPLGLVGG